MSELPDEVILAVVALENQYGDGHHSFELREGIYDLLSSSQARLSEAVKVMEDMAAALDKGAEVNTPDLMEWISDRLVHVHGESQNVDYVLSMRVRAAKSRAALSKAKAFLATLGEKK